MTLRCVGLTGRERTLMALASTGTHCVCLFGLKPFSYSSRCRWMASIGMRRMGRSTLICAAGNRTYLGEIHCQFPALLDNFMVILSGRSSLTSLCSILSPWRTSTRPAIDRSRSNHVCQSPPPYGSTFTIAYPDLMPLDTGLSLKQGLHMQSTQVITLPVTVT